MFTPGRLNSLSTELCATPAKRANGACGLRRPRCLITEATPSFRRLGPAMTNMRNRENLNRFPRIRHRRRETTVDRKRLAIHIGRFIACQKQSHRRQFMRLAGALQGIELADLAVGAALARIVEDRL